MTPEEYLSTFASKLNLTDKERVAISQLHNKLRDKLREKLPIEDDFLTGSYPRNTIIRPQEEEKFDVDFFIAFSNKDFGEYELPKLLEMVKKALVDIMKTDTSIVGILEQKRSIAVEYHDGFQIDVVPAIEIKKDIRYKIFDKRTQQAIESNPKLHSKNLTEANESTEYGSVKRLVPIIKLLKSWKINKCDYVKSFHLELLVVEILKNKRITSFSSGLIDFFSEASNFLQEPCLTDPANEKNVIDAYLDEDGTRETLLKLIAQEMQIIESALKLELNSDFENSVKDWKKIFESNEKVNGNNSIKLSGPTIISQPSKQHFHV